MNAVILLAMAAGHTALLVMLVNRLHALPWRCATLRRVRLLHDVAVPALPLLLFWFAGIRGPSLLVGGNWADLPAAWAVFLSLSALGWVSLVRTAVWHVARPLPAVQASNHSHLVDIEQRLGYRPLGEGPYSFLANLPGNEIFRVQVSEKEYRLPRLPAAWDGLSILHLTDLHFHGTPGRAFFEEVAELSNGLQADLIVFTGDLLDDPGLIDWLPTTLGRLQAPLGCYFILGNHDWYLDAARIRQHLTRLGWIDVAGQSIAITHRSRPLAIAGTEYPWLGDHPDLALAPREAFRLLLSHTPDNLPWARQQAVDLMLAGHNHGGQVVLPLVGPIYSPSRYGCRYAAGAFWEPPTLLYVSRGISGRHPLRWNCPPELTKLVLRPTLAMEELPVADSVPLAASLCRLAQ